MLGAAQGVVTGECVFRVRLGTTYLDEYETMDGRVYKRTIPDTDTEEGLALEEELDEHGYWPPQEMEVETQEEQGQEQGQEAQEEEVDEIGSCFA